MSSLVPTGGAVVVETPPPTLQEHRVPVVPRAQRSTLAQVGRVVGLLILIIAAMTALGPLLWTLTTSMRTPAEAFTNPPQWLPLHPDFSNYAAVFDKIPIERFFVNSVVVTGLIVLGQTVTCTLSGYAFAMVDFPGRSAIFAAFLATLMVPLQTIIIPVFVIVRYLGLADTTMSLVVSALGNAFGTFLMRQYFMQMPRELGEAARIDGAGHFQVFSRVYARMAGPAIATLAILNFSGFWAEFYRPLIFLQTQDNFTLPLGLVGLQGNLGTGSISVVLAGVVLAMLPSVVLFVVAQRYFIAGVTAGSSR
ncbi:carbohydrate ABC transporter permease [Microlunatus flavus]|uniref:Multiple sugar transport system permease protein n=1 Tax=Microlunatus flavus TaxID=1036181 RepID=A0A1H9A5V5_9ACTN|nr:carbohydrate ABC transporter permease [Microlunatus flavus]SEP72005.1 multiple sugar transport system permease protein [Microlunatus flavus]